MVMPLRVDDAEPGRCGATGEGFRLFIHTCGVCSVGSVRFCPCTGLCLLSAPRGGGCLFITVHLLCCAVHVCVCVCVCVCV